MDKTSKLRGAPGSVPYRRRSARLAPMAPAALVLLLISCSLAAPNGAAGARLSDDSILIMSGEWERVDRAGSTLIRIPLRSAPWRFLYPERSAGQVSYRAAVALPGPGEYWLSLPHPENLSRVSVDGATLFRRSANRVGRTPPPLRFTASGNGATIELVVEGGDRLLESPPAQGSFILLGTPERIFDFRVGTAALVVFFTAFFAVAGVLALSLRLGRDGNRNLPVLAAWAFALSAYYAFRGSPWLRLAPFADGVLERGLIAANALQISLLGLLFSTIAPGGLPKAARIFAMVLPMPFALAAALPFVPAAPLSSAAQVALVIAGIVLFVGVLRNAAQGASCSRLILPASLMAAAAFVARIPLRDSVLSSLAIEPAGVVVLWLAALSASLQEVCDAFDAASHLGSYVEGLETSMGRFIPREFLDELQKAGVVDLKLGDHVRREMTIFFSDIRSFTSLSERLTPEENFRFVNSYLARMVPVIKERGGFVDKYIGDAIMALFPGRTAADDAVAAAVEMQKRVIEYNRHRANSGYAPIAMGVGIHTGDLMLGVVGVDERMENTVVSDSVNLASRLQAIAKAFNLGIVISEQCFKTLTDPGSYHYRFFGKVRVMGKAAPVSIFEILDGLDPALFDRKMRANTFFEQGMLSYYGKDFPDAMFHFRKALELVPEDGAVRFYLETCMSKTRA
ncbi:MAG: adenylate/guanylate cyclase domain-containing protein [Spirochaetales bacterium]|nr:adenylate/guanylate cyclase domain-containing protein [Spirochaetales bacterium]